MMTVRLSVCDKKGKESIVGIDLDVLCDAQDFLDDISQAQGFGMIGDFFEAGSVDITREDIFAFVGDDPDVNVDDILVEELNTPMLWFDPSAIVQVIRQLREHLQQHPQDFCSNEPTDTLEDLLDEFTALELDLNDAAEENKKAHLRLILG